jgi:hypothetical protein
LYYISILAREIGSPKESVGNTGFIEEDTPISTQTTVSVILSAAKDLSQRAAFKTEAILVARHSRQSSKSKEAESASRFTPFSDTDRNALRSANRIDSNRHFS